MEKVKVLVTTCGSVNGLNVIGALKSQKEIPVEIYASDCDEYAVGKLYADYFYISKNVKEGIEFIKDIIWYCTENKIKYMFPTHSCELELLKDFEDRFKNAGINIMLPSRKNLDNNTKLKMMKIFEGIVLYPKIYFGPYASVEYPCFIKNSYGSGSTYAKKIENPIELTLRERLTPYPIVQEYIEGNEYTINCLFDKDSKLIGCIPIQRIKTKNGMSVVSETSKEDYEYLKAKCEQIGEEISAIGPVNIQVIKSKEDGQYYFIEINPRFACGTLPTAVAAGFNIPLLMLKMMMGKEVEELKDYKNVIVYRPMGAKIG